MVLLIIPLYGKTAYRFGARSLNCPDKNRNLCTVLGRGNVKNDSFSETVKTTEPQSLEKNWKYQNRLTVEKNVGFNINILVPGGHLIDMSGENY